MAAHAINQPIPTLEYPSQRAAIVALYDAGNEADEIAALIGAPINSVHRSLTEMRRKRGLQATKTKRRPRRVSLAMDSWPKTSHGWQMRNYAKAVNGARAALEAMGK